MKKLPFSITTRADSPYFYVRFRNEQTGEFMTWLSTKERDYNRAVRKAWDIYNNEAEQINRLSFYDSIKKAQYTKEDVQKFLEDFIRKGFLSSYILNDGGILSSSAFKWFIDFWNPETSVYLHEKKRKGYVVHKKHIENSQGFIKNHWTEILNGKKLGEINRFDIQKQFNRLDNMKLNGNTKNHILRAVLTPLKWAYNNELLTKDISHGWIMYKSEYKKRTILSMEEAIKLFSVQWDNQLARLASLVAMCTGMRCGEIQALTENDLGDECIFVRHSYNTKEGLKCTKNGESRTVYVPFPFVMEQLRYYAMVNIHKNGCKYIFASNTPDKPLGQKVLLKNLRRALNKINMDEAEVKNITFHAWRHFYATYMSDKINPKTLQKQTGHKTAAILEHYTNHETKEEAVIITNAQKKVFGILIDIAQQGK